MRSPMGGDLGLCDCAGCGAEVVGENTARVVPSRYWAGRRAVAGRINGRPYCPRCLGERSGSGGAERLYKTAGDGDRV